MSTEAFTNSFLQRFGGLKDKIRTERIQNGIVIQVALSDPYYVAYIEEFDSGYIVGINELHDHFDLESKEENLQDAFDHFDEIINDKIVAVGLRENDGQSLIAVMEYDQALQSYGLEKPKIEIIGFQKTY